MKTHTQVNPTELHTAIKLGIDAHAKAARRVTPLPNQKMIFDGLLQFVAKHQRLAREVTDGDKEMPFDGASLHPSAVYVYFALLRLLVSRVRCAPVAPAPQQGRE